MPCNMQAEIVLWGRSVHHCVLNNLELLGDIHSTKSRSLKQTQSIGKTNTLVRSVYPLTVFILQAASLVI